MSALDLVLMTHTTKCNQALMEGKSCICGKDNARKELNDLLEQLQRTNFLLSDANLEIQNLSMIVGSRPNMAWFDVLLQIVNLPSGEKRDKFIELVKQSVDASAEFIPPELSPAAKYYGIIQEVVETLAENGGFDRTIVAIRDELGSDLNRYTSLEWHLWAEEKPENKPVLICYKDGLIQSFMRWPEFFGCDGIMKWAYLPFTGWTTKE